MGFETADIIIRDGLESFRRYYSVYRGVVVNNEDDMNMNRLKVHVPEVNGGITGWAFPRGQHGSTGDGFKYFQPQIGDVVYVTFEYGDPTKPLWEYHGWAYGQMPSQLRDTKTMGIVTPSGNYILLDDSDGVLSIYTQGDITVKTEGSLVVKAAQQVVITSDDTITINEGRNGGLVNINDLTTKLNNLVRELEVLRVLFNTHMHSGVTTGPGTSAVPVTQATSSFSTFSTSDYEDTKVSH